jgi:predicted outer membrane repeat protein
MYNNNSSPAVTNVTFSGNSAQYGGGMYNIYPGSSPTLTNVTFSGNSAQYGGGMQNFLASPALSNVTFSGNSATQWGGGMYNSTSNPTLANVTFNGNSAAVEGGGMDNHYSSPTLTSVTFSGNMATGAGGVGGGMYNYHGDSKPTLTNVTFSGNSATQDGGGMDNYAGIPTLTNVTFVSNTAGNYGGGIFTHSSSPTLTNVTFSGNSATQRGGGMYNTTSNPTLTNVTFSGNSASYGGGMANYSSSNAQIRNTVLWGNTATVAGGQIHNVASTPVISYSVVQGGCPLGSNCTTIIITTTPMLGPLGNYGGATQTIPLLMGSSAIDAGNATYCPATDQRGVARVGACDIGAFEQDDFTTPTVDTFMVTTPSTSFNITVSAFTASDNIDVTGYLITESATPPVIGAEGWTGTAPTTYTVATDGAYTLYPWAKDAAGNVSDVFASPREVVVDTTAPAVVSIVRASANPTSAAIVTFTVTFSEAVTGVDASDFALTKTFTLIGDPSWASAGVRQSMRSRSTRGQVAASFVWTCLLEQPSRTSRGTRWPVCHTPAGNRMTCVSTGYTSRWCSSSEAAVHQAGYPLACGA